MAPSSRRAPNHMEEAMNENESLLLMCGWVALAVMNLILIAVAYQQIGY